MRQFPMAQKQSSNKNRNALQVFNPLTLRRNSLALFVRYMAKSWAVCCASYIGLRSKFSLSSLALSPSPLVCWHGLCVYVSNTHSGIICASCHIAMLSLILSSLYLSLVEAKAGRAPWSGVFFYLTSGFLFYFTLLFCLVIKFFCLVSIIFMLLSLENFMCIRNAQCVGFVLQNVLYFHATWTILCEK